jgi:hypothetical protein
MKKLTFLISILFISLCSFSQSLREYKEIITDYDEIIEDGFHIFCTEELCDDIELYWCMVYKSYDLENPIAYVGYQPKENYLPFYRHLKKSKDYIRLDDNTFLGKNKNGEPVRLILKIDENYFILTFVYE